MEKSVAPSLAGLFDPAMRHWCLLLIVFAAGLGTGCQTKSEGAAAQSEYKAPARGADVGILKGTRRRMGFLADDHLGYVLLVDRKFVPNARKSWDKPIMLEAGRRTITVQYTYGTFTARADIALEVKPGTT